jgi:hypothetical protein
MIMAMKGRSIRRTMSVTFATRPGQIEMTCRHGVIKIGVVHIRRSRQRKKRQEHAMTAPTHPFKRSRAINIAAKQPSDRAQLNPSCGGNRSSRH